MNLLGAGLFVGAALGAPSPLVPLEPPPFYAAQVALVIGLFAGVYAWLATRRELNRPLLAVGALGEIGFFTLFVAFWLAGDLAPRFVLNASPDVILGGVFAWWLLFAGRPGVAPRGDAS